MGLALLNRKLSAGPTAVDLKPAGCTVCILNILSLCRQTQIKRDLRAGQTAACSVELVSGILIVFVIFSLSGVLSFIFAGRGAQMRGQELQGAGSLRCAQVSPLPKVLSLALPLSLSSPL